MAAPGPVQPTKEDDIRYIKDQNRVRILWKLKTPAVYIDHVMMADGFSVSSAYGSLHIQLDIPQDFPIES